MDNLEKFLNELTELTKKYNIELWSEPTEDGIRLELNGLGEKGTYKDMKYVYNYGIEFDKDKREYTLFKWIPSNIRIQMD